MERAQKLKSRLPGATIALAIISLVIYLWPNIPEQFVYNRQTVLDGEVWRLFTAPLVHFSFSHLLWNLLLFVIFGPMLEAFSKKTFLMIFGFTSLVSGFVYLVFFPNLANYGGMSGVVTGIVAYLGFSKVTSEIKSKRLWQVLLVLLFLKITFEALTSRPLFASPGTIHFIVLPSAHLIGMMVAMIYWSLELGRCSAKRTEPGPVARGH